MGANCPPLVAYLFLFCYERELMSSPTYDKQADIIEDFNTTTRYLDDILNITNIYFDNMASQKYLTELQINQVNISYIEASFL